jgi:hypothetical protein
MICLLCFVMAALTSPFKSKIRLEAENAALRHHLIALLRKLRGRVKLANSDRCGEFRDRRPPSQPRHLTWR